MTGRHGPGCVELGVEPVGADELLVPLLYHPAALEDDDVIGQPDRGDSVGVRPAPDRPEVPDGTDMASAP